MKINITDDSFVSWAGHSAEYNFAIFDELKRRGIDCQIFAHNDVSQFRGLTSKAKPTFRHTAARFPLHAKFWPKFIYKVMIVFFTNASHLFDLLQKVTSCVDDKDLLLIGDFSSRTSIAYSIWLFYLALCHKTLSVVVLVHVVPQNRYYYWELLLFKTLACSHRLTLAAQNQAIADVCSKYTRLKCRVFPTPQTSHVPDLRVCQNSNGSEVAFAFLGVALIEKGFDVLVDEISLLKDMLNEKQITLTVQCNIISGPPILYNARDKLLSLTRSVTGLKVIEGALPTEQFLDVLRSTDILIFPYRPEIFKYIQSGIFTQALTLGKIVIVTEDTFIASELTRYGSGIAYRFGAPAALSEAIKIVVNNIETMKEKAKSSKDLYYQIHNSRRYVDLLLEPESLILD